MNAQIIPFDNYTVTNINGLPSNYIFDIEQDHLGYLWLATQNGAVKFDGYNFTSYTIDDGMPANCVIDILIDSKKKIWFATESGGLACLNNNNKINVLNEASGLVSGYSLKVFEDKKGNIWYISDQGFSVIQTDTILSFDQSNSPIISQILCAYLAIDGTIWLTTIEGIYFFDKELHTYINDELDNLIVRDIIEDKPGSFWFASQERGVLHFENNILIKEFNSSHGFKSDVSFALQTTGPDQILVGTSFPGGFYYIENDEIQKNWSKGLQEFIIWQILVDERNRIWLRTNVNGIVLIENEKLQTIREKNNLVDNQPMKIFEDDNGNIWIPTKNGISKYGKIIFHIYKEGFIDKEENIISIGAYKNVIYAGTDKGLNIIKNNELKGGYDISNIYEEPYIYTTVPSILPLSEKEIWLGTYNGLTRFDGKSFFSYFDPVFVANDYPYPAWDIKELNNDLYCASEKGLIRYDRNKYHLLKKTDGLADDHIWSIEIDSNQNIWCATVNGLSIYDGQIFHNYDTSNGLPINLCHDIAFDRNGFAWLATDKGISRIKVNLDWSIDCRNIGLKDGLYSENVQLITVDRKGYVWAGHNKGLNRIDPKDFSIIQYGPKEGFLPIENSLGAVVQTDNNDIWFGTQSGVVRYIPQNDVIREDPPKVYITKVSLFNDSTPLIQYANGIDSISQLPKNLELKYNKNNLVFSYVGLHYTIVEKNKYKYKLEGYDNYWSEATTEIQTFPYQKIPPGKYTFKVKASNCDGIWNREPASFSFEIKPPFYNTWWFYTIEVLAGIALLILVIRYRERKLRHDREMLAQKVKERTIEVETQRDQLAQQKKEITDSIVYAERIQSAVLPNKEYVDNLLKNYFILYKPRDIVSGDFYWIDGNESKVIVIAADCTGHGVPGALMSMLGISILNEVANPSIANDAGKILDTLRKHLTTTLWQTGKDEDTRDGMDLSMCIIDFKKKELQFAGAYNPLILIRKSELVIYKGDRMPVGYHDAKMSEFTSHSIQLIKGDCLYLFSDGYADQFGGADGKKFKSSNFRELLLEISNLPMEKQKVKLNETIEAWMGINEQVDDILVIGIRV